jgi:peptidoglycan/xylan/chitin deacetylase (PgdA/CDA1 family)
VKKFFVIFCFLSFLVVMFLSCDSDEGPTGPDPVRHDTTHYPVPDKLCALTFDDGPDSVKTPLVLDKLEYYQIVATFFVIGQKIDNGTKSILERQDSLGCEIGNHSYGWQSMISMTTEDIQESVRKTDSLIEHHLGVIPTFFRPPNLAVNTKVYNAIDKPFASGVLGYDWDGCGNTAEEIAGIILRDVEDGAIILLHDVQESVPADSHPTPPALDSLIPALRFQGYEFVTLSELFDRKGVDPDNGSNMWVVVK